MGKKTSNCRNPASAPAFVICKYIILYILFEYYTIKAFPLGHTCVDPFGENEFDYVLSCKSFLVAVCNSLL